MTEEDSQGNRDREEKQKSAEFAAFAERHKNRSIEEFICLLGLRMEVNESWVDHNPGFRKWCADNKVYLSQQKTPEEREATRERRAAIRDRLAKELTFADIFGESR